MNMITLTIIQELKGLQRKVDINTLCDFNKDFKKIINKLDKIEDIK